MKLFELMHIIEHRQNEFFDGKFRNHEVRVFHPFNFKLQYLLSLNSRRRSAYSTLCISLSTPASCRSESLGRPQRISGVEWTHRILTTSPCWHTSDPCATSYHSTSGVSHQQARWRRTRHCRWRRVRTPKGQWLSRGVQHWAGMKRQHFLEVNFSSALFGWSCILK